MGKRKTASGSLATGRSKKKLPASSAGKLRIGDDWNAIRIIALSQSNPLKAIAEFVENSIDAGARNVTITRFRRRGSAFISIQDDGDGVPHHAQGHPDFAYVATHICDSLKRQLKSQGQSGIQGEFGIGLLSFWTVGQTLSMVCGGTDGKQYEMRMASGDPGYTIISRRSLVAPQGTKLTIGPLLPGIRHLSGEKMEWFLASELRDRIRTGNVDIRIIDRLTRNEFSVEPRQFEGQLLRQLPVPQTQFGDVYVEIYLGEPKPERVIGLSKSGTRVIEKLTSLDAFQKSPWNTGYFVGVIDAPFLNLTPGTRLGVIHDGEFQAFVEAVAELECWLDKIIVEQQQIANEQASKDTFKALQKAFREALLILPEEEYDWFDIYGLGGTRKQRRPRPTRENLDHIDATDGDDFQQGAAVRESGFVLPDDPDVDRVVDESGDSQKSFFEHAGPLFSARISPTTCTLRVDTTRNFQAIPRDRNRRLVEDNLRYSWRVIEGTAELDQNAQAIITLIAPSEPQLVKLELVVTQSRPDNRQGDVTPAISVSAEAIITVTDSVLPDKSGAGSKRGLPEYTFDKQPGQLWRSRFDTEANLIVINSGHRDFVYASRNKALKLRYICRLFGKELVLQNFPGLTADQLLERMIELTLYTEENLR